jgi:hypothetical protein
MSFKRSRQKPDLFSVLLVAVALGMSVTLAYQINVYYGVSAVPIATQTPAGPRPGGLSRPGRRRRPPFAGRDRDAPTVTLWPA